jgi:hypothetical protein
MKRHAVEFVGIVAVVALVFFFLSRGPGGDAKVPEAVIREVVRTESVFVTDTLRLTRTLARWDTIRATDTIVVDSIVYVPRTIVDSIVAACRPIPGSCASLVAAVRDSAAAARDRAWQAAGLTYPFGVFYERDLSKWRAGASVRMDPDGKIRGELRGGVRW